MVGGSLFVDMLAAEGRFCADVLASWLKRSDAEMVTCGPNNFEALLSRPRRLKEVDALIICAALGFVKLEMFPS